MWSEDSLHRAHTGRLTHTSGEQGAMTEIATLLLDFILTMVLYGVLPMIFAGGRNKAIKDRKYKLICYAINFPVMLVLQRGGSVNLIPYVFWTFIFSHIGMRILSNRGVPAVASENAESLGENVEAIANKTEKNHISGFHGHAATERNNQ